MPVIPPIVVLALGLLGAAMLTRLIAKGRSHANADLDALRAQKVNDSAQQRPTLKRDPRTGIYRP